MPTDAVTLKPQSTSRPRDTHLDTVKFLLIFSIYIFHFEKAAGNFYPFVNIYQVAIFFLISGFWALDRLDKSVFRFFADAFKKYLIYWLVWVAIYTAYYTVGESLTVKEAAKLFVRYFSGVRATGIAGMWFTPAFFFASLFYFLIAKTLKLTKIPKTALAWVCCGICFAVYYLTQYVRPIPMDWKFSLGFVPEYLFYFSVGAVAYIYICAFKQKVKTSILLKLLNCLATLASICYFLVYFFKKEDKLWGWIPNVLDGRLSFLPDFVTLLAMFVFISCVARCISCEFTAKIGRNTLGLCHCEMFTKASITFAGSLLGLRIKATNPINAMIFAMVALVVGSYVVLPVADRITKRILSVYKS